MAELFVKIYIGLYSVSFITAFLLSLIKNKKNAHNQKHLKY